MLKAVVFLSNLEQLNKLHNEHAPALETAHIISLDLDVSAYLRVLGYEFAELMDYLSITDIESIYTEAERLKGNWHQIVEAEAQFEGVNPLVMERHILTYFFRDALLAIQLFQSVFAQLKFEQIILFASEQKPFVEANASADVRNAIWQYMTEAWGLKIQKIESKVSAKRSYGVYGEKFRLAASLILKSATNPFYWQLLKHQLFKKPQAAIVFIVTINESYRYGYVAKELKLRFKNRFFSLVLGTRRQGSIYISQHDVLYHPFGLLPGTSLLKARSFARQLYKLWKSRISPYGGDYPQIFDNLYLNFQFDFFFNKQVPNALENYRQAQTIFRILKPAIVLTTPSGNIYQSSIIEAARQQKIPAAILPHSAIPEGKDVILSGDYIIAWSRDFIDQWQSQGVEENRIFVTGLPRSLVDDGLRPQATSDEPEHSEKKTILLLLATASVAGVPIVDLNAHFQSLKNLVQIPEHLRGKVKLVFKLHPSADYQYLYQHLATEDVEIIRHGNLANLVKTTDVSVLINIPTSAYLIPLYEKKPLLFIRTSTCLQSDIGLVKHGGEALITSDSEIWLKLERVLFSSSDQDRILQANHRYMTWMGLVNHSPLDALANAIEKIAQT
jgi:hypothetical protein